MLELILTLLWFLGTTLLALSLIRRRHVVLKVLVASSVLILNGLLLYTLITSRTFQLFGEMVLPPNTEQTVIALTFDDGPTPQYTHAILKELARNDVRATFFLTGREVSENPAETKAIIDAGHEVGNHSWSHRRMIGVSPSFVRDEIETTDQAIRAAGYTGPILFRSPYGKRFLVAPWYLARTNRPNVFWDIAPDDNPDVDSGTIVNDVVTNARPGSIVLLHLMYRSRDASREALPGIIRGLREKGYRFVTVSELRRIAEEEVDQAGALTRGRSRYVGESRSSSTSSRTL